MLFVVLCPGTSEGSTGSGSGFKASQKTGQRLIVSSRDACSFNLWRSQRDQHLHAREPLYSNSAATVDEYTK